jgi:hypothetical protein
MNEGPDPEAEGTLIGTTTEPVAGVGVKRVMFEIVGPGTGTAGGTGMVRPPRGGAMGESGGTTTGAAPGAAGKTIIPPVTGPAGDVTSADAAGTWANPTSTAHTR